MKPGKVWFAMVLGLHTIAWSISDAEAQVFRLTDDSLSNIVSTPSQASDCDEWDQAIEQGCCATGIGCRRDGIQPLWSMTADALFLERSDPGAAVLALNTVNPVENLDASDFGFKYQSGFDVSLSRRIGCDHSIELRYFGVDDWNSTVYQTTTPDELLRVNAAVPIFTFTGDAIAADYTSQLHNVEFNGRHQLADWLQVLVGFRYAELDEHVSASLVNSAAPFSYNAATQNRLYGGQLGGQASLWSTSKLSLDAIVKAGVFGNHASQDGTISTGLVTLPASGSGNRAAFIGETGLTGTAQLTHCLALRGGYRLLWLDGVALGSDQLGASDFANGTGFHDSGDVFYQGAFIGLEFHR